MNLINNQIFEKVSQTDLKYIFLMTAVKDIAIDIFKESMHEYAVKLLKAVKGRYDLDDYDKQVILVALGQFLEYQEEHK